MRRYTLILAAILALSAGSGRAASLLHESLPSAAGQDSFDLTAIDRHNPAFILEHGGPPSGPQALLLADIGLGASEHDPGAFPDDVRQVPGAAPEPATWAAFLLGLALTGAALRRRPLRSVQL